MRGVKKTTFQLKYVLLVSDLLVGEKNGNAVGNKSSIVVKNAKNKRNSTGLVS
jgi:hypothetical protein